METQDKLEYASELIHGMKSLCQLLSYPNVPLVTKEILIVFECIFDKVMELIGEIIKNQFCETLDNAGGME